MSSTTLNILENKTSVFREWVDLNMSNFFYDITSFITYHRIPFKCLGSFLPG